MSPALPRGQHVDVAASVHESLRALPTEVVDRLDRLGGDPCGFERFAHDLDEHGVRFACGAAAPEHGGIAGTQRERRDIDRNVGSRFVDGADHAEGHAHLLERHAVGHPMPSDDATHRVGEGGHLADGGGESRDTLLIEAQAIDQRVPDAILTTPCDIESIRLDDARRIALEPHRDRLERARLLIAGESGCRAGGFLGTLQAHLRGLVGHPPSLERRVRAQTAGSNQVPMSAPASA